MQGPGFESRPPTQKKDVLIVKTKSKHIVSYTVCILVVGVQVLSSRIIRKGWFNIPQLFLVGKNLAYLPKEFSLFYGCEIYSCECGVYKYM